MYAITGFEATGKDKLFTFGPGAIYNITDFSSGTQADGGASLRQAVWISNCSGDGSNIYLAVQTASIAANPHLTFTNCLPKIGDGDDRILHVRKGCNVFAITDSATNANVRVVEVA